MDVRFTAVDGRIESINGRFEAADQKAEARFDARIAAISESKAQAELTSMRVIASLSERVAVLKSQRH